MVINIFIQRFCSEPCPYILIFPFNRAAQKEKFRELISRFPIVPSILDCGQPVWVGGDPVMGVITATELNP